MVIDVCKCFPACARPGVWSASGRGRETPALRTMANCRVRAAASNRKERGNWELEARLRFPIRCLAADSFRIRLGDQFSKSADTIVRARTCVRVHTLLARVCRLVSDSRRARFASLLPYRAIPIAFEAYRGGQASRRVGISLVSFRFWPPPRGSRAENFGEPWAAGYISRYAISTSTQIAKRFISTVKSVARRRWSLCVYIRYKQVFLEARTISRPNSPLTILLRERWTGRNKIEPIVRFEFERSLDLDYITTLGVLPSCQSRNSQRELYAGICPRKHAAVWRGNVNNTQRVFYRPICHLRLAFSRRSRHISPSRTKRWESLQTLQRPETQSPLCMYVANAPLPAAELKLPVGNWKDHLGGSFATSIYTRYYVPFAIYPRQTARGTDSLFSPRSRVDARNICEIQISRQILHKFEIM